MQEAKHGSLVKRLRHRPFTPEPVGSIPPGVIYFFWFPRLNGHDAALPGPKCWRSGHGLLKPKCRVQIPRESSARIAQSVEHLTFNQVVEGSIPSAGIQNNIHAGIVHRQYAGFPSRRDGFDPRCLLLPPRRRAGFASLNKPGNRYKVVPYGYYRCGG